MSFSVSLLVVVLAAFAVQGDIYLHNMRGSNNRLDEARRDRNNANRMFDSQNNNRGGYNVGSLYFYEGEQIPLEWSAQHSCGTDYNDCQLVLQYMCGDNLRDGADTRTIPDQPSNCANSDCNTDVRYGMHETYDYYTNCRFRQRNRGLFTADRNLNGNSARFTRQNEDGTRRGYECPEERDHYPYWHPAPWIDIAILTTDASRCEFYRNESENVKGRYHCRLPDDYYHFKVAQGGNNAFIPNVQPGCLNMNNKGSEMNNFLLQKAAKSYSSAQSLAISQQRECEMALSDCSEFPNPASQPNQTDLSAFAAYNQCIATFKSNALTNADLEAAAPSCADGKRLHPHSSCRFCIPNTCVFLGTNVTAFPDTQGCPSDYSLDVFDNAYCISNACANQTSTFDDAKKVDDDRSRLLVGKYLVGNVSALDCIVRETLTSDCFARNIPKAIWELKPAHNVELPWLGAPACREADWSRVNHHGNGLGGFFVGFNLTFPPDYRSHCALRLRYNITTADYNGLNPHNSGQVNSSQNGNPAKLLIREAHNIPMLDSAQPHLNARGYVFKQNPQVEIFDFAQAVLFCAPNTSIANDTTYCLVNGKRQKAVTKFCRYPHTKLNADGTKCISTTDATTSDPIDQAAANNFDFRLQLAINTAQLGRTFEDRTHTYAGRARDDELKDRCDRIYALNVRGKRGNIVQVYPGVEYDFVPDQLHVAEGDCIHFQWTGSNTNPNENDGQGKEGTDRHNIALQEYVRGEGARGVEDFGGKGDFGTTWTTKNMEPGWEGWNYAEQSAMPTMADMSCPPWDSPKHSSIHPLNSKLCTLGNNQCNWTKATPTAQGFVCPAGTLPEDDVRIKVGTSSFTGLCIPKKCKDAGYRERPSNPRQWFSGLDPRDVTATQYNSSAIGMLDSLKFGTWGTSHPEHLDNVTKWGFIGLSYDELVNLAILKNVQFGGEMSELDDAGTYFDLPPHKVVGKGSYHYMCTRNNNFSNRSQKGKIVVSDAPEAGASIGVNGGDLIINIGETYQPPSNDAQITLSKSDFWVSIPPKSFPEGVDVKMSVIPASDSVGMTNAGGDVLYLGPGNLAAKKTFPDMQISAVGPARRRDGVLNDTITVSFQIVNGTTVWYRITSPVLFKAYVDATLKTNPTSDLGINIDFQIGNSKTSVRSFLNNQFELEGMWSALTKSQLVAIEDGGLWLMVTVGEQHFKGNVSPDPASGGPITVRMPVSVTVTYGKVYFVPDTETGRRCIMNNNLPGCSYIRSEVANARISDGEAVFVVGASQTSPGNGFYQPGSGSNLPIIVGVTVACVVIALMAICSAIYFRKHPHKWDAVKLWGPQKYKSLTRSLAPQV